MYENMALEVITVAIWIKSNGGMGIDVSLYYFIDNVVNILLLILLIDSWQVNVGDIAMWP